MARDTPVVFGDMTIPCDAFVRLTMMAMELHDPRLLGGSERVACLTVGLAENADAVRDGPLRDLHFDRDQIEAIRYASLLRDIGMLGVPKHLLAKERKLDKSELDLIETSFKYAKRTLEAGHLRSQLQQVRSGAADDNLLVEMDHAHAQALEELDQLLQVVRQANEPLSAEVDKSALIDLSRRTYTETDGSRQPMLTAQELAAVSIRKGFLSQGERRQIHSHVSDSFRLLSMVPWSGVYGRIPEIAYAHHEKMDGSGYPRGISAADIPLESRMITIADTFDALVAWDRPHQRAMPVTRALDILQEQARQGKLDQDLLRLFIEAKVYELPSWPSK